MEKIISQKECVGITTHPLNGPGIDSIFGSVEEMNADTNKIYQNGK